VTEQASVADIAAGKPPPVLSNPLALARIGARCQATANTVVAPDQIDK
jgi:D-serine deaminase-like pyridoxal phosphate-dependent protein